MPLFTVLLCVTMALQQSPQELAPQLSLPKEEPRISIVLENATITDAVLKIGAKFKVNILTDVYVNDAPLSKISMENMPLEAAVGQIATLYGRDVYFVNRTYILRSRSVLLNLAHERTALKDGIHWADEGSIAIMRLGTSPPSPPNKLTHMIQEVKAKPLHLPASLLSLEIRSASLNKVMSKFNSQSAWFTAVETELGERRITAYLPKAPPAQFIDSLSKLLNASQRLTLQQTEDQKMLEKALLGNLSERERLSHALADKLSSLLSKEQKARKERGEQVAVLLKEMPSEMQAMALDYMKQALQEMPPPSLDIDMKRLLDGGIVFLPPPSNCLGVRAFMPDGTPVGF